MSTVHRIAKNTAALAVGNLLTKIISLAFFVFVARKLGEISFGRFSTAMALVGLVEILPGYLSRPYLIREIARDPRNASRILSQVTWVNVLLSLCLFGLLWKIAPHFGYHSETVTAIALLAFALVFDSCTNSYHAAFAGFERMELSAMLNIFNTLATVIFGGAMLLLGFGLIPLICAYLIAKVATLFLAFSQLKRLSAQPDLRLDLALTKRLLQGAWPFFITTLFVMLYARLDIVMLSFFRGEAEVGFYNAAYKVMEGLGLVSASFVAAMYPVLARLFVDRPDRLLEVYRRALKYLLAFVLPAAAGLAVLAKPLMPALFGSEFGPAAIALSILVWGQALDSINPLLTQTLRATDRERSAAWITGIGAAVNLLLNVLLIPPFGLYGAAVATVLSFAVLLMINLRVLHQAVGAAHMAESVLRIGGATAVMLLAVYLIQYHWTTTWPMGLRLLTAIGVGAPIYLGGAWIFGILDAQDRGFLVSLLHRKGTS